MNVLDEIIRSATFAGDVAAFTGLHRSNAEKVGAAVDAAIRVAVANGVLLVADNAEAILNTGFKIPSLAEIQKMRKETA